MRIRLVVRSPCIYTMSIKNRRDSPVGSRSRPGGLCIIYMKQPGTPDGKSLLLPRIHSYSMEPGSERSAVIGQLARAVLRLESSFDERLVPIDGARIVYAVRGASDPDGVAGITGGIAGPGDIQRAAGACASGADGPGSRTVLTAMKSDPAIRAAALLKYSPAVIRSLEAMLLECCSFDRTREPPGLATMDWGVASCCREGVPDVIFDKGAPGREGLVRMFGEKPDEIVNNIIILSDRIMNVEL